MKESYYPLQFPATPVNWQLYEIACTRVTFRTSARSWQPVGLPGRCRVTLFARLRIGHGPVLKSGGFRAAWYEDEL